MSGNRYSKKKKNREHLFEVTVPFGGIHALNIRLVDGFMAMFSE
jgi:hypothetical protein